jgi:hypothetical protein
MTMLLEAPTAVHVTAALIASGPLLYAALSKLLAPDRFSLALPTFGLGLPQRPSTSVAIGLAELGIGIANVLVPSWQSAACLSLFYLAFGVVIERARRRGASGDCGCFGALPARIDRVAVVRNLGFALAAATLAVGRAVGVLVSYEPASAAAATVGLVLASAALDTYLSIRVSAQR